MAHFNPLRYAQVTAFIGRCLSRHALERSQGAAIASLLVSLLIAVCWSGYLEAAEQFPTDLTELSLEELMNIEVTSVAKKPQKLTEAAAAIFVITQEDIRRSGVTSIPEVLRMVPGMQVAWVDANKWAISSRGFNALFANKLLVLIDGRSVYTPMFSGVFWEAQDVLLEDLDRIEVIRGPGATLWGANAVNGVINILTKNARDTQGRLLTLGVGSEERGFGGVRYGGKLRDHVYYRVYAKYFNRDDFVYVSGEDAADGWEALRGGFRIDWDVSGSNSLTLQGDIYNEDVGQTLVLASLEPPFERTPKYNAHVVGGDLLGRWEHTFSDVSDMALQLYYDRIERDDTFLVVGFYHTFDLDFQHRLGFGERQEIVWGLGYRLTSDHLDSLFPLSFNPDSRDYDLLSIFVQDEITLVENRLRTTLGSKFEHNDFTGFEIQPNVRLLWTPNERHTVWSAVSRAVRTPSRGDDDMRYARQVLPPGALFPDSPTALVVVSGNRDYESEELLAFELGYHLHPMDWLFLDLATFYNVYGNLRTIEPGLPFLELSPSPPHLVIPVFADNKMDGETYGGELSADWQMSDGWRLRAAYSYLQMQLYLDEDSGDTGVEGAEEGGNPHHQLSLRSSMDLSGNLELDLGCRYVDNLPSIDVGSYFSLDVHLGWHPRDNLEVSVVGQNLLDDHHPEFRAVAIPFVASEVGRGLYGKITWGF